MIYVNAALNGQASRDLTTLWPSSFNAINMMLHGSVSKYPVNIIWDSNLTNFKTMNIELQALKTAYCTQHNCLIPVTRLSNHRKTYLVSYNQLIYVFVYYK